MERINIAQSGSITRFVANMTHLQPSDPVEAALCDSYFEAAQDEARVRGMRRESMGDGPYIQTLQHSELHSCQPTCSNASPCWNDR